MNNIANNIKVFLADEQGAETVEWAMIAAILASVITVAFLDDLGSAVETTIGNVVSDLGGAQYGGTGG